MSRALGRSVRALGSQQSVALASMLALAACGAPANPTTNSQYLVGEAPEDSDAAGGSQETASDQGQDAGDPEAAPVDTDTDGLPPRRLALSEADTVVPAAGTYSRYIALGDSFASGYGLDVRTTKTKTKTCAQDVTRAWPPLVKDLLKITGPFTFGACSGATTLDVLGIGPLVGPNKPQAEPQIALLPPPEQLDSSALITIQIGGNDLKLDDTLQTCFGGLNALTKPTNLTNSLTGALVLLSPTCTGSNLLSSVNDTAKTYLEGTLFETFLALREKAPNARIVAVGYPHLFSATSACPFPLSVLLPVSLRQQLNELADEINNAIRNAAKAARILSITDEVVDAFDGHEMCTPGEMISSFTGHPNAAGHQAYARVVAEGVPPAAP